MLFFLGHAYNVFDDLCIYIYIYIYISVSFDVKKAKIFSRHFKTDTEFHSYPQIVHAREFSDDVAVRTNLNLTFVNTFIYRMSQNTFNPLIR